MHRPVEAIMVFHDSVDWGRDLQVIIDALTSRGKKPLHAVFARSLPSPTLIQNSHAKQSNHLHSSLLFFHDVTNMSIGGYMTSTKTQKELHTSPQTVPLYFSNSDLVSFPL